MTDVLIIVLANVVLQWRFIHLRKRTTLGHLVDAARLCERQGWTPLEFKWAGLLRREATLLMRNKDSGELFTVRARP